MTAPVSTRPARTANSRPRRSAGVGRTTTSTKVLGYVLVAPIVLIMAFVIAFPLVNAVVTSLQDQRVIGSPADFVGFDTYSKVLGDDKFWAALGRSGIWLIVNMIVQTILAFATALLLQRSGWWSKSARTWVVLPWVVPTVAVAVIWQWLLNSNYGIIHKIFAAVGIDIGAPFADGPLTLITVILVNSWHWFPLSAVVIYGALATVPHEVIEAAKMDGANAWRTFWSVTFPLLQPVLFALGLVGSLWSFNVLDTIYLTTKGGPAGATTTMPVYIYDTAFSAFRSSEAAAASVLTVIVLAIAGLLFVRFAKPKDFA
ncbi:carbohydrate ABC transporter permease [Leifsonia sp. Le1]|uniref:carbohydrate ABC transporter permease n=1 Tax=Leifsonia sp. Le1 TaxID=3404918 RepID=UPI003EBB1E80